MFFFKKTDGCVYCMVTSFTSVVSFVLLTYFVHLVDVVLSQLIDVDISVTSKKSPNVNKGCTVMIPQET